MMDGRLAPQVWFPGEAAYANIRRRWKHNVFAANATYAGRTHALPAEA